MKREILHRGKHFKSKKWIFGNFIMWWHDDNTKKFQPSICELGNYPARVYVRSVGEYIGFDDINDKRIFENDIVKAKFWGSETYIIDQIVFVDGQFKLKSTDIYAACAEYLEVIGNTFDNAEMLVLS